MRRISLCAPPPPQVLPPRPPQQCLRHHGGGSGLNIDRLVSAQLGVLEAACPDATFASCTDADRERWTAAALSRASCHALQPAGAWSHFRIETYGTAGGRKQHGGDSWVVALAHQPTGSTLRARVLDEGDGTYLVAYVPHLPGIQG